MFGGWSETLKTELDSIEKYDVQKNVFEELSFKMHEKLQNCLVVQISSIQVLILGGWSDKVGDSEEVKSLNVETGEIEERPKLI